MKTIHLRGAGHDFPWSPTSAELTETINQKTFCFLGSLVLTLEDPDSAPPVYRELSFYIHSEDQLVAFYKNHDPFLSYTTLGDASRDDGDMISDGCGGEQWVSFRHLVPKAVGIKAAIQLLETGDIVPDANWQT